jgi:transmembrane sensor
MTEQVLQRNDKIPPERLAEAAVWVARLHSGEIDRTAMAGVKQWLKAHPMNERALGLCTEIWEESANLRRITPFATQTPAAPRRYPVVAAAAAAALLLVSGALLWVVPGAQVSTEVGEQRLVALKDGTHVFLNTATRLDVKYDANVRLVELKTGEALFDVAKKPTWPFIVIAGNRKIRALGTSFVVRRDETQTAVTLVEGTVTVTSDETGASARAPTSEAAKTQERSQAFTLTPGQRLTFRAGQARLDMTSLDKAVAWRRGEIIFDDTPLSAAVSELNRYSKDKLIVEQPEAQALLVTGLFQTGDSVSFAHAVAESFGLTVKEQNDEIVISGSPLTTPPRL